MPTKRTWYQQLTSFILSKTVRVRDLMSIFEHQITHSTAVGYILTVL